MVCDARSDVDDARALAARCTGCGEPCPRWWITDGLCPWCDDETTKRACGTCGVKLLPSPYYCPCDRTTRSRLNEAEDAVQLVENAEAEEQDE
jgi:hypothetical protein